MTEDGASEPNWRVHQVLLTEEAIYGLILVSGMIVVSGQSGTISSMVPTRPVGDLPRLILRGSTTMPVKVRSPSRRERAITSG